MRRNRVRATAPFFFRSRAPRAMTAAARWALSDLARTDSDYREVIFLARAAVEMRPNPTPLAFGLMFMHVRFLAVKEDPSSGGVQTS